MRKLWLENDVGKKLPLQQYQKYIFSEIDGIGSDINRIYLEANGVVFDANPEITFPKITGNIVFRNNTDFVNFGKELAEFLGAATLIYNSGESGSIDYRSKIKIDSFEKSEKDLEGNLVISIIITRLTTWFLEKDEFVGLIKEPTKTYPYIFNYNYGDITNGGVNITNNSNLPAYLLIEAEAEVSEFSEIQYDIIDLNSNEIVQSFKYFPQVEIGEKLILDSRKISQSVTKILNSGEIVNVYQEVDFSRTIFLFLSPGTWNFRVTFVGADLPRIKIFYNEETIIV